MTYRPILMYAPRRLPTPSFVERHSRFLSAATLFVSFLVL